MTQLASTTTRIQPETPGFDKESIKKALMQRLVFTIGKDEFTATPRDWFYAVAFVVRDHLIDRWMQTMRNYYYRDVKRIYYLSLEFLIGRTLMNSLLNLGFYTECREALQELGFDLQEISNMEDDAALGNGGLGRLAACFLDSMATLQLPGYGYGIRYEYGMFNQGIENGHQVEHPEHWLRYGNPWEFARPEVLYKVRFYGQIQHYRSDDGETHYHWTDCEEVMAMAYDTPVPGYQTATVNNMRLWSAKASRSFDLKYFNEGNYIKAVEAKNQSETLSRILYPSDSTMMGRELRLKQEYFFVSASLQDIIFRYRKHHLTFTELPDKIAIQLNDTHPAIAVAELMRILVDVHHCSWDEAWTLTTRIFSYTNHTLMPEALETWSVNLFSKVLPRHMQIIFEINHRFLQSVMHRCPGDVHLLRRISIIDEDPPEKRIRMAHLAIIGSHKVNGVAALHTQLMQQTIFADFYALYPEKFINITNGVTPRRWLQHCNRPLAQLITQTIGAGWQQNLMQLQQLVPFATQPDFIHAFQAIKQHNKDQLTQLIQQQTGLIVSGEALFDVQIKRIHEYKRQLLNILHVITRYNEIRQASKQACVPRVVIIAGKAAPGYRMAKLIIKLIHDVANIVNHDPAIANQLKVVFMPNYNVTLAERIIPAAELSQQISTAGTEASGTGNMKLAMNGALTIGTLDGANVEIMQAVGAENIFIFGLNAAEVAALKPHYQPWEYYQNNLALQETLNMIRDGFFSPDDRQRYHPLIQHLLSQDSYCLLADYATYIACQRQIDAIYRQPLEWNRRAILNVANMGRFSSDRTIADYAQHIWRSSPIANTHAR